ncbi:hypothetical protein KSP40_PGU001301 [Platanthera guangdongensis]|uniref:Uncharacterized protein n=1 Tax=Platanthera guangdongensis TaxID=2320717 RepID=A0ABR2LFT8_9ASPA
MEINKQQEEASLEEFIKVSLEGFSWAENICQRVENVCVVNNMVQNPGKCVSVVGKHFRRVIDTLVNDLCDHADDVLEFFSEISFGHASLVMASGTKGEELDNRGLHEKHSTCAREETELTDNLTLEHHTVPSVMKKFGPGSQKDTSDETFLTSGKRDRSLSKDGSLSDHGDDTMVHEEENISVENFACDRPEDHCVKVLNLVQIPSEPQFLNKKDVSTCIIVEAPMFDAERLNSVMHFCDAASLDVNLTASISVTEENFPINHQSIQSGRPSPFNSIYILDIESEETSFLLESDRSELALNKGAIETEKSMKYADVGRKRSSKMMGDAGVAEALAERNWRNRAVVEPPGIGALKNASWYRERELCGSGATLMSGKLWYMIRRLRG